MTESELKDISNSLARLMPTLDGKLLRPVIKHSKDILSPLTFMAMQLLVTKGPCTMTEIANEMMIAKSQLTAIIDKLIDRNWVVREPNPKDRRVIRIVTTPAGKTFIDEVHNQMATGLITRISSLEESDLLLLKRSLSDLNLILEKL